MALGNMPNKKNTIKFSAIGSLVILLLPFTLKAQTVEVNIKDSLTNTKLPFATIRLAVPGDSTLNRSYSTDKNGNCSFVGPKLDFLLSVSYIGYQEIKKKFTLPLSNLKISLSLIRASDFLKEVTISSKVPVITQIPEGYVYNIDRTTADINVNTGQLLKKLPGVNAEQSGELRLQGKPVSIYIDGKPSLLSGTELTKYLQSLNLQDVRNLKVLATPPANYDAAGGAIIEINTNKGLLPGISTRVDANGGTHDKYGAAVNLSYKSKIYTGRYNVNYDHGNYFKNSGYTQTNKNTPDSLRNYVFNNHSGNNANNTTNITLNNDFSFNARNTLGITFKFSDFNFQPAFNNSLLSVLDGSGRLRQTQSLSRRDESASHLFFIDLNYRVLLGKKGANMTFDTYYWKRKASNTYALGTETITESTGDFENTALLNNSSQDLEIKSAALNFSDPINKYITFLAGAKVTDFAIDGQFNNALLESGSYRNDPELTYQIAYRENVYAGFISAYGTIKKLQYSIGLRGEGTSLNLNTNRSNSLTNDGTDFFKPFPVASFNYNLSAASALGLAYSRRIFRVSYSQLNPIDFRVDPSTIQRGNPALTPSTTNNIVLSYNYQLNASHTFVLSSSYLSENNPYTYFTLPDSTANTYINEPRNYKNFKYLTLSLSQQHTITKKVSVNLNLLATEQIYNLSNLGLPKPNSVVSYRASLTADFKFWKNAVFEVYGNFKSRSTTPFGTGAAYQYIDISASKRFLRDNLVVNLSCTDVFNINKSKFENDSPFYLNSGFAKTETRIGQLSLSYKFGKTAKNNIRDYTPQEDTRFKN